MIEIAFTGTDSIGKQNHDTKGLTRNNCSCCSCKRGLEEELGVDPAKVDSGVGHKEVSPAAEGVTEGLLPKTEPKAKHPVGEASEDDVHGILHHNTDLILGGHGATLQQPETWKRQS